MRWIDPPPHWLFYAPLLFSSLGNAQSSKSWLLPQNSEPFHNLWATMDSIQEGLDSELSILYIGGSHVQGGWLGHAIRSSLTNWAPEATWSRGMMLPYRIASTNTPTHFRTEYTGEWTAQRCTQRSGYPSCTACPIASGIIAFPRENASIHHVSFYPDSTPCTASAIEVWTNATLGQWKWTGNGEPVNHDSLPNGLGWRIELNPPGDTLGITFDLPSSLDSPDSIWFAGFNAMESHSGPRITLHEWGHNGARASHVGPLTGWKATLDRLEPDIIFVGIGLNDAVLGEQLNLASFQEDYSQLTAQLSQSKSAIVLVGNTIGAFRGKSMEFASKEVNGFLKQHAEHGSFGYMDLACAMGGYEALPEWRRQSWLQHDEIHFTEEGYFKIATLIVDEWLMSHDARSNIRRP